MVYLVGVCAAVALGLGWVLQQRVASRAPTSDVFSLRLLLELMHRPLWWAGIVAMVAGQSLGGWALQLGPVSLVVPLLSASLLVAFVLASFTSRRRPRWVELSGAALITAAIAVFLAVGSPQAGRTGEAWHRVSLAVALAVGLAAVLVLWAHHHVSTTVESVLFAAAAGVMYGLADTSTRGVFLQVVHAGFRSLPSSPWPYLMVCAAAVGVWASQSAFRSARLDYSLPPTTATEPIVGVVLGMALLGDRLRLGATASALEACSLVALLAGTLLISRSPALARPHRRVNLHKRRRLVGKSHVAPEAPVAVRR